MILVAATALGCAVPVLLNRSTTGDEMWSVLRGSSCGFFEQATATQWADLGEKSLELGVIFAWLAIPVIGLWTLSLVPIRLLPPRPPLRQLGRQPGLMAALAVGVATVIGGLHYAMECTAIGWESSAAISANMAVVTTVPTLFGLAVLVAWMTLIVGRRWRAEASWIDRLGRAVGFFWIVAGFAITGAAMYRLTRPFNSAAPVPAYAAPPPPPSSLEPAPPIPPPVMDQVPERGY
jgi:hypothetical protein